MVSRLDKPGAPASDPERPKPERHAREPSEAAGGIRRIVRWRTVPRWISGYVCEDQVFHAVRLCLSAIERIHNDHFGY